MLTRHELARLERSLRATKVLSVYIDGAAADPAERTAWRRELERMVSHARDAIRSAPHDEREAFERCVAQMHERLAEYRDALRAAGWVGFFAGNGEYHAETLPVPMPNLVVWGDGARVAPYVRALKQHLPALVAVVDSRIAHVHLYARGAIEKLETLRADVHVGPMYHMGAPSSVGFHTGTRGRAGSDEADRELRAGTEALVRKLAALIETLAGQHAWILVGGIPGRASEVVSALPERLRSRACEIVLDVHSTEAQIREAAEHFVTMASRERDLVEVVDLLGREAAGGRGATGWTRTCEALREHAVERAYFTGGFVHDHAADAEALVRLAFEHAAELEYVSGKAAERLDASGGVGALLRFVPTRGQPSLAPA